MDSSREHFESQQPAASGMTNMKALKTHGAATVAELREFLGSLRDRSPQEVMGIVTQSSLFQGTVTATIGMFVILVVGTIGPYLLSGAPSEASAIETQPVVATNVPETAPNESKQTSVESQETTSTEPDLEKAAKAMGIGEAAGADPNKNPLDSKLDKLLDGIE